LDSDEGLKDKGEVIQRFDSKHRQTVRNLRIREDLPKYLRNLSTKSAFYDPKTRSMRANPYSSTDITDETYMGDNFVRNTGDAEKFDSVNKFAWQSRAINGQKSDSIHLQSNPTMTELAFKQFNSKKSSVQDKFKANLMKQYGGNEHALTPNADTLQVLYGQNESYREFGADGRVIKGQQELIATSKYAEDEHPGNHSSVWGSFFDLKSKKWGYARCHCLVYHAYCTGNDGIKALNESKNKEAIKNKSNGNGMNAVSQIGVVPKPKEMDNRDKLVNPSGYISTRGIMASKGIPRKNQRQRELEEMRKLKKREKRKQKKLKKRMKKNENKRQRENGDGYNAEIEGDDDKPPQKKTKLNVDA